MKILQILLFIAIVSNGLCDNASSCSKEINQKTMDCAKTVGNNAALTTSGSMKERIKIIIKESQDCVMKAIDGVDCLSAKAKSSIKRVSLAISKSGLKLFTVAMEHPKEVIDKDGAYMCFIANIPQVYNQTEESLKYYDELQKTGISSKICGQISSSTWKLYDRFHEKCKGKVLFSTIAEYFESMFKALSPDCIKYKEFKDTKEKITKSINSSSKFAFSPFLLFITIFIALK